MGEGSVHEHQPLLITDSCATNAITTYKEPWTQARCAASVASTGKYEAAGNFAWVGVPLSAPNQDEVARAEPSWAQVLDLMDTFFTLASGDKREQSGVARIVYPIALDCSASAPDDLHRDAFNGSLTLLTGHALAQSLWLATFMALRDNNMEWTRSLWQCWLTVTIHVDAGATRHQTILRTLAFNEAAAAVQRNLCDTFVLFARKVGQLQQSAPTASAGGAAGGGLLEWLRSQNLKYNGAVVNKTMLTSVDLLNKHLEPAAEEVLRKIERAFGTDVLATSYNKLMRLVQAAVKAAAAAGGASTQDILVFLLEVMYVTLRRGVAEPRAFTVEMMDKGKKGAAGWLQTMVWKHRVLQYIMNVVAKVVQIDESCKDELMTKVRAPALPCSC